MIHHEPSVEAVEVSAEGPDGYEQTLDPVRDREVGRLKQERAHALRRVIPHSDTRLQGRVEESGIVVKRPLRPSYAERRG